jgi:DNA-binding transcriptional MerR regulator
MHMGDFVRLTGLSEYTIRYYEKAGVLRPAKRDSRGLRKFDESDIAWMEFVQRLKDIGMPIGEIKRYAELRVAGDGTKGERLYLLEAHERRVVQDIAEKSRNLEKLREKIEFYKKG